MFTNLRKNKKLVIAFFSIGIFFSIFLVKNSFSEERELIELETEIWSGQKILDGEHILGNGQLITIEKGTEVIFTENSSLFLDGGVINAIGTAKEPIFFKSDNGENNGYHIFIGDSSGIYFKNVDLSGGGYLGEETPPIIVGLIKKVQAQSFQLGVLNKTGGSTLILDNCKIHDNKIGIKLFNLARDSYIKVNRTSFYNNNISVIAEDNQNNFLDFQYNWWESDNQQGIIDNSNPKEEKNFKDPVIVIPGIMGSAEKDGEWKLDPIFGTYNDLIKSFLAEGYVLEKDLFLFPYQWRDSNVKNAVLLKSKIQAIKSQTKSNKVDIVAHSMGGLLAREYLEADDYWLEDDVDQLITLGTPHNGAPEIYSVWEAGEFLPNLLGSIKRKIFKQEAEKAGHNNIFDYIRSRPIESVRELLPTYEYLWDKDFERYKEYPAEYPRNEFLENLNLTEKMGSLGWIEFINIYGNLGGSSTINEIKVINETIGEYWEHGYPDGFDKPIPLGDRGFNLGLGDKTVPIVSALYPSSLADYNLELNSGHGDLPTNSQQDVLEFLTGERPAEKIEENSKIVSFLSFWLFSPIDIQIVLEDGKRIGTDFETGESINELEDLGAYYTGNDTENEFITIPNYSEGKYQILTSGTDSGEFRIEVNSIEVNDEGEAVDEQLQTIQGSTAPDQIQDFDLQIGESASDDSNDDNQDDTDDQEGSDSNDEEDDEDDDKDKKDKKSKKNKNEDKILGYVKNQEKKEELNQKQAEKKDFIEDKKIAKKEAVLSTNKKEKDQTKIAGEKSEKFNPLIIFSMILIGVIALLLTWTIGKENNFIKKHFK